MVALCCDVQLIDTGADAFVGGVVAETDDDIVIVIVMVEGVASFCMGSAAGS